MFKTEEYIQKLTDLLQTAYHDRLLYVGLQGSYLRNEATENSDIDIMVVIDSISVKDLNEYRNVIKTLDDYEKSCGFICGREELQNWNSLEICHLLHTTKDYFGCLSELVPEYTEGDVRKYVKMNLNNLYHEICHRYVHASRERNIANIRVSYRSVFFILQNLYYLESGIFINSKKELSAVLSGKDKLVLDSAISINNGAAFDFDNKFSLLFSWCKETMIRI